MHFLSFARNLRPKRIYKIDPQGEPRLMQPPHTFLVKPVGEAAASGLTEPRDILREAAKHILHEDLQHQSVSGVLVGSGLQTQEVVVPSPGFVRVTPNCITVKSPLAKKPQKVKKSLL
jgi:hypothetical protein